ncbi:hypothetical protein K435DRAFT_680849, partial [Dendrothele bispora CBS 962.96]
GEYKHQELKHHYSRTNKQNHEAQIAQHEYRKRLLQNIQERNNPQRQIALTESNIERLPYTDPEVKYHMAFGKQFFMDLDEIEDDDDNALKDFHKQLKIYVLHYLFQSREQFFEHDIDALVFENNRIYRHKVVRINYTTYDLRRDQDSVNPRTHPDIIVLSPENSPHPFTYGRVVGVFHANVRFKETLNLPAVRHHRVDFLWVRWYQFDSDYPSGWQGKRLHRLSFLDSRSSSAFGFVDPADVLRGVHIIPAFHYGKTQHLLPSKSIGRQYEAIDSFGSRQIETTDWKFYYVNM